MSVAGSGVCSYSVPHADFVGGSVEVRDKLNASITFSLTGALVEWNCSDASSPYAVSWQTPAATASVAWSQDSSFESNMSQQYLVGTITVTNPSAEDYVGLAYAVSAPSGFTPLPSALSFNVSAGTSASAGVFASGSGLSASWGGGFVSSSLNPSTSSLEWTEKSSTVSNAAGVAFSNITVNSLSEFRSGWNCSAPSSISIAAGGYSNASFIQCSKENPATNGSSPQQQNQGTPTPSASGVTPSATASVSATPSASSPPSETVNESESLDGIDIRVPSEIGVSYQTVYVFDAGAPAAGDVEIIDPDGKSVWRTLASDGAFGFFFDREGEWTIKYGNHSKKVSVLREREPRPSVAQLGSNNESLVGGATGLAASGVDPAWLVLLLLLVLAAVLVWYYLVYSATRVEKKFAGDAVTIKVVNRVAELRGLELTDVAPEQFGAREFSEPPQVAETVIGTSLKWKRDNLAKGSGWTVSYKLPGAKGKLKHASLTAKTPQGKEVKASSGEVSL